MVVTNDGLSVRVYIDTNTCPSDVAESRRLLRDILRAYLYLVAYCQWMLVNWRSNCEQLATCQLPWLVQLLLALLLPAQILLHVLGDRDKDPVRTALSFNFIWCMAVHYCVSALEYLRTFCSLFFAKNVLTTEIFLSVKKCQLVCRRHLSNVKITHLCSLPFHEFLHFIFMNLCESVVTAICGPKTFFKKLPITCFCSFIFNHRRFSH